MGTVYRFPFCGRYWFFLIKLGSSPQFSSLFVSSIVPHETSKSFGGIIVVSAPKFKLSVLGVLKGFNPAKVRGHLSSTLNMNEQQVEALLHNDAPVLQRLMDHEDAFKLKSALLELGVDCAIKPVPLVGLAERADTLRLHSAAEPKAVNRAPVTRSSRPSPVRTGKASARPVAAGRGSVSVWPVVAMLGLVLLASWLFKAPASGLDAAHAPQVASMLDSRAID